MNIPPPRQPQHPPLDLVDGNRQQYLDIVVPLYDASFYCNWKTAEDLIIKHPNLNLVGQSITEHQETPLHVAASAKVDPKKVKEFVQNLVAKMTNDELELQNKRYNTAFYLAAVAGNVETVEIMLNKNKGLLNIRGGGNKMMPLYAAALYGSYDVVKYMHKESPNLSDNDGWNDMERHWLLQRCCENSMFDVALEIVNLHYKPGHIKEVLGILARKPEAFKLTKPGKIASIKSALPLLRCIWGKVILEPRPVIDEILRGPADLYNRDDMTVSGWAVLASQFQEVISLHVEKMNKKLASNLFTNMGQLQISFSESVVSMRVATQRVIKNHSYLIMEDKPISNMENQALALQRVIFKYIAMLNDYNLEMKKQNPPFTVDEFKQKISDLVTKFEKEADENNTRFAKETYSSRVLFLAAETGNTVFLVELIRKYPDLIWKKNSNGLSIFHVAAQHRHENIYKILYEIGAMKDLITTLVDRKGNNMLHLVGKIAKQERLEVVSGVALQMQRELYWFNEVKTMIPTLYIEKENAYGFTPQDIFTMEHKDLAKESEKWLKGTASQCMVVATLITTIVFAAAFTVPGGYGQANGDGQILGKPVFHSKATLSVFVVADAISLVLSSTSILIFLSVLTSRYSEQDYLKTLPRLLTWGLAILFLSIVSMMVAFGVSFFVLYDKGFIWMPILICMIVVLPAIVFLVLQLGLFFDVFVSAYRSGKLFEVKKPILAYKNPNV